MSTEEKMRQVALDKGVHLWTPERQARAGLPGVTNGLLVRWLLHGGYMPGAENGLMKEAIKGI